MLVVSIVLYSPQVLNLICLSDLGFFSVATPSSLLRPGPPANVEGMNEGFSPQFPPPVFSTSYTGAHAVGKFSTRTETCQHPSPPPRLADTQQPLADAHGPPGSRSQAVPAPGSSMGPACLGPPLFSLGGVTTSQASLRKDINSDVISSKGGRERGRGITKISKQKNIRSC